MDSRSKAHLLQASLILATVCTSGAERLGDFNGDGKADVLLRHDDGSWRMHVMDGASAGQGLPVRMTPKLEWYWMGAGDFNGDGWDDVMLRRDDGVWVYYPLDGSRVIAAERGWANLTRNPDFRVVGVGDFNADGRDDILMRRTDGAWAYYPMNGRRVIRAQAGWANLPREVDWRVAGVGDFDGDGQADVLLRHIDGPWRHYAMDGRRVVPGQSRTAHLPRDPHWRLAGIGDFHGDGRDGVLLRHADGRWRHQTVDGTGGGVSLSRDWAWRLAAVGDGDGDGRDDVVLRHDDGRWRRHPMVGRRAQRGTELDLPQTHEWAPPTRPVYFPDAKLRGTFKDALGKAGGQPVRARELATLKILDAEGVGIADLTGIGSAIGLSVLRLDRNEIQDISPLAGLKELEELHLESNSVSDITALAGLVNLDELNLAYNRIADLGPLADNVGLDDGDHVDVRGNPLNGQSIGMVVPTLVARGVRMDVGTPARLELTYGDSVQVMHVGEDLATLDLFSGLPLDLYSTVLYSRFEDVFDFIMFFSNLDDFDEHEHAHYYGVYSSVRNDTAGVGLRTFYDNRYGSAETLKGVIHYPYNRALRSGPSLHEILHAWANYTIPTAVGAHWGFSSANGQLGGFDIGNLVELGDNRYAAGQFGTFANGGNRPAYSPIELYFAGYIPPEEVADLWVAADGEWVVEDGDLVRTEDGHGIFTANDVRTYSIEDIVAKAGPRTPSMAEAQWHFRVAVVLLTDDDHPATDEQLALLSDHAAWFSLPARDESHLHNFFEATGGRGTVTMDGLSQYGKAIPAAATGLPASFGTVPEPRVTLLDGRCLPLSAARLAAGSELRRDVVGADGRLFIGER